MIFASHSLKLSKPQSGVTLIELVVTLAILAILVGIAVPSMNDLIKDSRLSSQTDLLVSTLNIARLEAVKQRADVKLCPVASNADDDTACSTTATDWGKGWLVVRVSDSAILQRVPSKSTVTVTNTSSTALALVTFNGTIGSAVTATGFTVCVTGRQQQSVSVAASGHVSKNVSTSTTCS